MYFYIQENHYRMKTIDKKVKEVLSKNNSFKDEQLKEFVAVTKKFNRLVEKGVTTHRGYNLMAIGDDVKHEVCGYLSNTEKLSFEL